MLRSPSPMAPNQHHIDATSLVDCPNCSFIEQLHSYMLEYAEAYHLRSHVKQNTMHVREMLTHYPRITRELCISFFLHKLAVAQIMSSALCLTMGMHMHQWYKVVPACIAAL